MLNPESDLTDSNEKDDEWDNQEEKKMKAIPIKRKR